MLKFGVFSHLSNSCHQLTSIQRRDIVNGIPFTMIQDASLVQTVSAEDDLWLPEILKATQSFFESQFEDLGIHNVA